MYINERKLIPGVIAFDVVIAIATALLGFDHPLLAVACANMLIAIYILVV